MLSTRAKNNLRVGKVFSVVILLLYTALALLPLYLMTVSSFIHLGTTFDISNVQFFPKRFTLDNLIQFNERVGGYVPRWFLNSFIVSTIPVVSGAFFGILAGYMMSKGNFPGKRLLFWSIIATMTIPAFVTLIPMYEMIWSFRWMDSYLALVVPGLAGIGGVFLSRQFISTLPTSLLESAAVDGCTEFGTFLNIVLPLCRPLLALLIIMGFVSAWQEYFWAYLVTSSRELYTVQMGIVSTIGVDNQYVGDLDYGQVMAASLFASLPIFIVFIASQKHFIKGLTIGAIKG